MQQCNKKECCFNNTLYCPTCAECGAPANEVSEDCVSCWNCANDEGYIRKAGKYKLENVEELMTIKHD